MLKGLDRKLKIKPSNCVFDRFDATKQVEQLETHPGLFSNNSVTRFSLPQLTNGTSGARSPREASGSMLTVYRKGVLDRKLRSLRMFELPEFEC